MDEAVYFFSSVLSKDPFLLLTDQEDILTSIPNLLYDHHNSMLKEIPSPQQIYHALISLQADKAPGLDGFPTFMF